MYWMLLGKRSVSRGKKASSPEFNNKVFNMMVCPEPRAKYSCWLITNKNIDITITITIKTITNDNNKHYCWAIAMMLTPQKHYADMLLKSYTA